MGFINLLVGSDACISIKNKQLFLKNLKNGNEIDYPLEDVNSVVIESLQSNITTKAINELASNNIATYFCDESHMPSSQILRFNGFYKNLTIFNYQLNCPKPLKKRLWQSIVRCKIRNQTKVLDLCNIDNDLISYENHVLSDDSSNIESVVALLYFKALFGVRFSRRKEGFINSALNYGYSIIRGAIARSIVAHGLLPFMGLHHCNQLNGFNLVDDLIEPFRAVVDLFVYQNYFSYEDELNANIKQELINLLNVDVKINNKRYALSYAIDLMVSSFVDSLSSESNKLILPIIDKLELHKYE